VLLRVTNTVALIFNRGAVLSAKNAGGDTGATAIQRREMGASELLPRLS
jgi:hypothetical protein